MEKQYTARVIENGKTTAECTGSLRELVHWAYSDRIGEYSRYIEEGELHDTPEGAYEWFIDLPEVQQHVREKLSSHELETWWDDGDEGTYVVLHTVPMPLTPEGIAAYIGRSEESVSHHGNQWWVEVKPAE